MAPLAGWVLTVGIEMGLRLMAELGNWSLQKE